jgi:hypothetical protein
MLEVAIVQQVLERIFEGADYLTYTLGGTLGTPEGNWMTCARFTPIVCNMRTHLKAFMENPVTKQYELILATLDPMKLSFCSLYFPIGMLRPIELMVLLTSPVPDLFPLRLFFTLSFKVQSPTNALAPTLSHDLSLYSNLDPPAIASCLTWLKTITPTHYPYLHLKFYKDNTLYTP